MAKSDQCQRARARPTRLFEVHPSTVGRVLFRDYEARIDVSEAMIRKFLAQTLATSRSGARKPAELMRTESFGQIGAH